MDFGAANYVLSSKLHKSLIHYELNDNSGYTYRKKNSKRLSTGEINEYWICSGCENIRAANGTEVGQTYSSIIVRNDRILRDPRIGHHTNCVPRDFGSTSAQQLDREARDQCRQGRKGPLEAHAAMTLEFVSRFPDCNIEQVIQAKLPDYKSSKHALRRWARKNRIPSANPCDFSNDHQVTKKNLRVY